MTNFIRLASPEMANPVCCQKCGALLPDAGTIQMAHDDWHKKLDATETAVRALAHRETVTVAAPETFRLLQDYAKGGS